MPEEVLFADERRQDRDEIAAYLRAVADKLDAGEPMTLVAGDSSVTVDPPPRPTFEVKVERETDPDERTGELSVELELEWDEAEDGSEDGPHDASLRIE